MDAVPGPTAVAVAVDAAGVPGGRSFSYLVPPTLVPLVAGEAVIVEYGRSRVVGVVLGDAGPTDRQLKSVLARVHGSLPLLPPLTARLAAWISSTYLAPPGMVIRGMLPPGFLETVRLVARAADADATWAPERASGVLAAIRSAGADGIAVDDLPRPGSRATLVRTLRELEVAGVVRLEWRVAEPAARPSQERRVRLTPAGRRAAVAARGGQQGEGRRLGPRQAAVLRELLDALLDAESLAHDPAEDVQVARGAPAGVAGEGEPGTVEVAAARLAEHHGSGAVLSLARRGLVELRTIEVARRPLAGRAPGDRGRLPHGASLTPGQAAVLARIEAAIAGREATAFLLDGPTASGKTAIGAGAVAAAVANGRGALVLVPEIALALPFVDRLRHDLGIEPALLHSGLSEGERADEWRRIRSSPAPVVVGTRLAVLAPIADLGVIVVDEEHDAAYKSDRTPRYQARDLALELGHLAQAPVVLASATPEIVTVGRARMGQLEHLRLAQRPAGAGSTVEVVDLRAELAAGNRGSLSAPLVAALRALDRARGDRAILVLNRRGSASVVLCRDCGHVQACPECQRPLVFHATTMSLRCHHCGATAPVATRCPACGSARIRYLGGGTQRVEREVRVLLPDLRVGRLDRDVVEQRGAAARVIDAYTSGALDVLVGTSLVTKGIDVPETVLVGVVSADVALTLPDERAAERTWQLLAQAVGRAGRGDRPGHAIVQTYLPDHPAIRAVADGDARAFVDAELDLRRRFGSPPFGRLVKLTAADDDRGRAESTARAFADVLRERSVLERHAVSVLGPVPAYVARRAGRWRFHVVLRGQDPLALLGGDPGPPWSVDVDPETLL